MSEEVHIELNPPPEATPQWFHAVDIPIKDPQLLMSSFDRSNMPNQAQTLAAPTIAGPSEFTAKRSSSIVTSSQRQVSLNQNTLAARSSSFMPTQYPFPNADFDKASMVASSFYSSQSSVFTSTTSQTSSTMTTYNPDGTPIIREKKPKIPSKWIPFSGRDSLQLELALQSSLDLPDHVNPGDRFPSVAVNEDYLYEVDVHARYIKPIYWNGPVYPVRRAIWFLVTGKSSFIPCDENLARQIEEGYQRYRPWIPPSSEADDAKFDMKKVIEKELAAEQAEKAKLAAASNEKVPETSMDVPTTVADATDKKTTEPAAKGASIEATDTTESATTESAKKKEMPRWPLFGAYLGQSMIYQDAFTAYLLTGSIAETLYSKLSSSVSSGGTRVVRGWQELKRIMGEGIGNMGISMESEELKERARLERKRKEDGELTKEEWKWLWDKEIEDNYEAKYSEGEEREINHLVFVVHGVGQKLGERVENFHFVHTINQLRRVLKQPQTVMASFASDDPIHRVKKTPSTINGNNPYLPENIAPGRGVQVLPIIWRKEVTFGVVADDEMDAAHLEKEIEEFEMYKDEDEEDDEDSAEALDSDDEEDPEEVAGGDLGVKKRRRRKRPDWSKRVPTLQEITPDGVPQFRMLVSDIGLDVLLYMTLKYRQEMLQILVKEMNRVFTLYLVRHPNFLQNGGKVSIIGHSLGSLLVFDLLCAQPDWHPMQQLYDKRTAEELEAEHNGAGSLSIDPAHLLECVENQNHDQTLMLNFITEHFFALGSPIGLFMLLKGHTLAPRATTRAERRRQMMKGLHYLQKAAKRRRDTAPVSRPFVHGGLYNIYHRADAVAYRMEPLLTSITPSRSLSYDPSPTLKPPALIPYNKGGLKGMHLGIQQMSSEIVSSVNAALDSVKSSWRNTMSIFMTSQQRQEQRRRERVGHTEDTDKDHQEMEGGVGYGKMRGLNPTGRIDWCIQEGVLENEYLTGLNAHFNYWYDMDVAAFIMKECCRS